MMKAVNRSFSGLAGRLSLFLLPLIVSLILSCEVQPAAAAVHRRDSTPEPPARRSSRSSRSSKSTSRRGSESESEPAEPTTRRSSSTRGSSKTKWTDYMLKYDIARSHGSGIYIDLGGSESVASKSYRMPIGKCPVYGKAINLANGADFLNSIAEKDPRDRGLGFPETAVQKSTTPTTGRAMGPKDDTLLSPVSTSDLRRWGYTNNDVANCAEYASNIVPGSDRNTKYRYPFVFDTNEKMCHVLYSPMQYNQGKRYCDADGSADNGLSSLLCMKPSKTEESSDFYYGSAKVVADWEDSCPMYPIRDAIFGKWVSGSCVALEAAFEEYVETSEDCSAIMFENSAADMEIDEDHEQYNELKKFYEGITTVNVSQIAQSLFSPVVKAGTGAKLSHGRGMNWANYDIDTGRCRVLAETPNCLIINAGSLAMTALGSPHESDAIDYPCDIDTNGYVEPRQRSSRNTTPAFEVTTALSRASLKCTRFVHKKNSKSCGTYYYCSEEQTSYLMGFFEGIDYKNLFKLVATALAFLLLLLAIYWTYMRLWSTKVGTDSDEYDRLMSRYEYEEGSQQKSRMEQQLRSDAYIWGEAAARPSDVTPVHLSKVA